MKINVDPNKPSAREAFGISKERDDYLRDTTHKIACEYAGKENVLSLLSRTAEVIKTPEEAMYIGYMVARIISEITVRRDLKSLIERLLDDEAS